VPRSPTFAFCLSFILHRSSFAVLFALLLAAPQQGLCGPLDPRGKIHIPIGIPNTLDTLKTFVEAEGNFSPGFATYGIYFWVFDPQTGKLNAPTMDNAECGHILGAKGCLIPWIIWNLRDSKIHVEVQVCEVKRTTPEGDAFVVGTDVFIRNTGDANRKLAIYTALRPLGPAGGDVRNLSISDEGDALLVDGHPALVSNVKPNAAGVLTSDTIGQLALAGKMPTEKRAVSPTGDCSGALRFDLTIPAPRGEIPTEQGAHLGFVCPVLPGRRAVGHKWDGKNPWAQLDEAKPNPPEGGILQPDPGLGFYRGLKAADLLVEATEYWERFIEAKIRVPEYLWIHAMNAILGHVAVSMNDEAPDVAVINYNVFDRDGVYVANILQKSGHFELAEHAIDYFLTHPFNGRIYPEADNPGQILWIMGEHWQFTRDRKWLERVYPSARKLAAMIQYYRTTPGPHWVCPTSLDFGDALPADKRQELKPGRCDGKHPEYTEAFDIAGLRGAVVLAQAIGNAADGEEWKKLAESLFDSYDKQFGADLRKQYGSYSVLWPCRLYPFDSGKAHDQFRGVGMQKPTGWRYFPLATAHQGLLAGNRDAAYATLAAHLDHGQMQGWYAFDEGGKSGAGGWRFARTTWNGDVAMPHGWAIAEVWLLLRDSLVFEDGNRLVLLAGVPPDWFTSRLLMEVEKFPTHFGACSFLYKYKRAEGGAATLSLTGSATPPEGFVLRFPPTLEGELKADGKTIARSENGDFLLPPATKEVRIEQMRVK